MPPSADLIEKIAKLAHLPLAPERAAFVAPEFSGLLKLLDLLEDADLGDTEPAVTFSQKHPGQ